MQQQTHLTSNKIPRQPKKIWKQVLLRKTKEKLYPKVLDNYRGSRDRIYVRRTHENIAVKNGETDMMTPTLLACV